MSKKLINTIIIILVFVIGLVLGLIIRPKQSSAPTGSQNTYQAGWNAAEQKLVQSGMVPGLNSNIPIKSLSGTVEKIDGNKLTVKTVPLNPLADSSLDERIVDVDSSTKIFQMTQKDPQEYQKEMAAFQKTMQSQTQAQISNTANKTNSAKPQTATPPMPFDKKQISLSDLKAGMQISITSSIDIKTAQEFTATEIDIQPTISQSTPAPSVQPTAPVTSVPTPMPTTTAPTPKITPAPAVSAPTNTTNK